MQYQTRDTRLWCLFNWALFRYLGRTARKILLTRAFSAQDGTTFHFRKGDIRIFLDMMQQELLILRPIAQTDRLPKVGNRIMVELAIMTMAAFRVLKTMGVPQDQASETVAKIGWRIYASQLRLVSFPFRLTTRDPAKRLQRTIRQLLRFPFGASGAPGYAVKSWSDKDNIYTYFTHCPPQTFVRDLIKSEGDNGELNAFFASWCQYDWPGADIIAGDAHGGHYARPSTLSAGDPVCDMCWKGIVNKERSDLSTKSQNVFQQ